MAYIPILSGVGSCICTATCRALLNCVQMPPCLQHWPLFPQPRTYVICGVNMPPIAFELRVFLALIAFFEGGACHALHAEAATFSNWFRRLLVTCTATKYDTLGPHLRLGLGPLGHFGDLPHLGVALSVPGFHCQLVPPNSASDDIALSTFQRYGTSASFVLAT